MTKTRSKVKICLVVFLAVIGMILTFASFIVPTTNTTFRGFFNAINYGYDINGGRLSIYKVDKANFTDEQASKLLDETILRYTAVFSNKGLNITRQGDTLRIETSHYDNDNIARLMALTGGNIDLFELISSDKGISITTDSSKWDGDDRIGSEYVVGCKLERSQTAGAGKDQFPITIDFSDEGKELLRTMTGKLSSETDDSKKKLYIYLNGINYNTQGFEISNGAISQMTVWASSSQAAESLYLQLSALAKPINLIKVADDLVSSGLDISPRSVIGNVKIMLPLSLGIILLMTMLFLLVRYHMLGVFGIIGISIFIVIYSFLLQSIPLIKIDVSGLLGVFLSYVLLIVGMSEIFEKIRSEYAYLKRIPLSVRSGFRKNVLKILEEYIFIAVFSLIVFFTGSSALKALSMPIFVGLIVNYFTLFVAVRGMCLSYTVINSTRRKFYNLKRGSNLSEV